MDKKIKSLKDLFNLVGGSMEMGIICGCDQLSVMQWGARGIPHKHWDIILKRTNVTHEDLYNLDRKLRAQK